MDNHFDTDITLDLRDLRCPHIVMTVMRRLRQMPDGHLLKVMALDLNAPSSLTSWCVQSGHELVDYYEENGQFVFFIRCRHTEMTQSEVVTDSLEDRKQS